VGLEDPRHYIWLEKSKICQATKRQFMRDILNPVPSSNSIGEIQNLPSHLPRQAFYWLEYLYLLSDAKFDPPF